ncbi:hypothetical protein D3C75_1235410 [compost metagenome]
MPVAVRLRALGSGAFHKHGTCGAEGMHANDQAHPETDQRAGQPNTTCGKKRELSLVISESSSRMPSPEALSPITHEPISV